MAALTASKVVQNVDMSVTYQFTTINDGDTFNFGKGKTLLNYQMSGNPSTQTDAGTALSYVGTTGACTFYPGVDGLGGYVRVYPK